MKRFLILALALVFVTALALPAFAQETRQYGKDNPKGVEQEEDDIGMEDDSAMMAGQQNQVQAQNQEQTQNQGEETQLQVKAENIEQLRAMIQAKSQEFQAEIQSLGNKTKEKVFQNQNSIREAVHALLASEDLVGGVGEQISAIAQQFNNSIQKTLQAEEKIQARSKVRQFFFGGDDESADELEQEVNQNQNRIQELKQLQAECNCASEVKDLIQEQVQTMEQEQVRLQQLAQDQKGSKGLFGWLFGWLKK